MIVVFLLHLTIGPMMLPKPSSALPAARFPFVLPKPKNLMAGAAKNPTLPTRRVATTPNMDYTELASAAGQSLLSEETSWWLLCRALRALPHRLVNLDRSSSRPPESLDNA